MNKKPPLTPWFSGEHKPVRRGMYQRKLGRCRNTYRWTGKQWDWKYGGSWNVSIYQSIPWRGLREKP